jgi:hypothetical protein
MPIPSTKKGSNDDRNLEQRSKKASDNMIEE